MRCLHVAVAVVAMPLVAFALDIPITLTEFAGVGRTAEPVTVGVPIPRGALTDTQSLCVIGPDGRKTPAQFDVTGWWWPTAKFPEKAKSIRWVLIDFQADVPDEGKAVYRLTDAGGNPVPARPVSAILTAGLTERVRTGPLTSDIRRGAPLPFAGMTFSGRQILAGILLHLSAVDPDGHDAAGCDPRPHRRAGSEARLGHLELDQHRRRRGCRPRGEAASQARFRRDRRVHSLGPHEDGSADQARVEGQGQLLVCPQRLRRAGAGRRRDEAKLGADRPALRQDGPLRREGPR